MSEKLEKSFEHLKEQEIRLAKDKRDWSKKVGLAEEVLAKLGVKSLSDVDKIKDTMDYVANNTDILKTGTDSNEKLELKNTIKKLQNDLKKNEKVSNEIKYSKRVEDMIKTSKDAYPDISAFKNKDVVLKEFLQIKEVLATAGENVSDERVLELTNDRFKEMRDNFGFEETKKVAKEEVAEGEVKEAKESSTDLSGEIKEDEISVPVKKDNIFLSNDEAMERSLKASGIKRVPLPSD